MSDDTLLNEIEIGEIQCDIENVIENFVDNKCASLFWQDRTKNFTSTETKQQLLREVKDILEKSISIYPIY